MLKVQRKVGPLTTEEIEKASNCMIIKTQKGIDLNSRGAQKSGLTLINDGVLTCIGRVQSEGRNFIPRESIYATKLCEEKHKEVGHIRATL